MLNRLEQTKGGFALRLGDRLWPLRVEEGSKAI
jgi:hypothetical protein